MKRTFVNIAAVLTALIVGLTINNACAEKIDSEDPAEDPVTVRFFVEDGLLFGPDGRVYNKLKSRKGHPGEEAVILTLDAYEAQFTYSYDSKGRLSSIKGTTSKSAMDISYTYKGLTVEETIQITHYEHGGGDRLTTISTYHSLD